MCTYLMSKYEKSKDSVKGPDGTNCVGSSAYLQRISGSTPAQFKGATASAPVPSACSTGQARFASAETEREERARLLLAGARAKRLRLEGSVALADEGAEAALLACLFEWAPELLAL